ncbi:O-antigen ligase family protein [Motiliproteus sediminis]|uniref:O-antigen ligase family protein n=1 Tax=Motiliproteus sediminis TaxID=1468178 RepID=UPI001AEFFF98|nr:O-antigen ligase family protein [Motiliproteus sediminis]
MMTINRRPDITERSFNALLMLLPAILLIIDRAYGFVALALVLLSSLNLTLMRNPPYQLSAQDKLVVTGLTAYPAAVALGMLVHGSWQWDHFDNPARLLLVLPIYFFVRRHKISQTCLYLGLIIGAIGAGTFGFLQKFVFGWDYAAGHIQKIQFGNLSLMMGILSLTCCIDNRSRKYRTISTALGVIAFIFGLTGSIASGARGGWIALPIVIWLILNKALPERRLRFGLYALLLVFAGTLYGNNSFVQEKVNKAARDVAVYFSDEKAVEGSAGTRLEMWRAAGYMFTDAPFIGVGQGSYRGELVALADRGLIDRFAARYGHAHNDFFHIAAEQGLLGLSGFLLFFSCFGYLFFKYQSRNGRLSTAGVALIVGFTIFGLTQALFKHAISTTFVAIYASIFSGIILSTSNNDRVAQNKN